MKRLIGFALVSALIFSSGCINIGKFEVHEWGVFIKGYGCKNVSALTFAPESMLVKKPVIHFHAPGRVENVIIKVENIKDFRSDPEAFKIGKSYVWKLSVDGEKIILPNGTEFPYIFYEGNLTEETKVIASVHVIEGNVTFYVKNMENYTISGIYFIYGYPTGEPEYVYRGLTYIRIDELKPGSEEMVTTRLRKNLTYEREELFNDLINRGLTHDEANELLTFWEDWWFRPTNIGNYTRLIYFIPQNVYDRLIPLSIEPKPSSLKRIGIVTITNIPILKNLYLQLSTSKTKLNRNESIWVSLVLSNYGNEKRQIVFPSTKIADFEIVDEKGNRIYLWSQDKAFAQVITWIDISPGEKKELLNESVSIKKEGNYVIRGWIYSKPKIYSNFVEIEVT